MADPLSIIASVVGIASAAVQSSKALFEMVDDVKGAHQDIAYISRDARAFYVVVFALNVALKEENIKDVVSSDEDMVEMINNLKSPLSNCQLVLGELTVRIQKNLSPLPNNKGLNANSLKWALSTKSKVRELQARLEASKSTLDGALGAVTTLCSVRLIAMGKASVARQIKRSSAATDASFAIRRFVDESISDVTAHDVSQRSSLDRGMENIVIKRLLCTEPPCALDFKDYTELGLHLFFLHREDNKNVSGHPDPFKSKPILSESKQQSLERERRKMAALEAAHEHLKKQRLQNVQKLQDIDRTCQIA